jgi:molybdopterin-guanine dinucleotide biosynthesis protein A
LSEHRVQIPAIVTAGDRRAAKAIYGESKAYLEIDGRSLVQHAVDALQDVPEVSEVWVVGNAQRLERVFDESVRAGLRKPLSLVPQLRNLFENGWETYRRLLPGAPPEGRDPGPEDAERAVLYLSADLPFATPQEISVFVRRALERDCDYAMGLVTEASMEDFYPSGGEPGIRMAYFNTREDRYRQSNLHLIRPAKIGNRHYIEEMYEHRYQKQFGNIVALAWRLLRSERGGLVMVSNYLLMQLASIADRSGWKRLADWLRQRLPIARIERACSSLLRCRFALVVTEAGGCGVDVDNEHDFDVSVRRYADWRKDQEARAAALYGPVALPARAGAPTGDDAA